MENNVYETNDCEIWKTNKTFRVWTNSKAIRTRLRKQYDEVACEWGGKTGPGWYFDVLASELDAVIGLVGPQSPVVEI